MKVLTKISFCLALMIAAAFGASAQDGTTSYEFLNVSPSSHVYGLGGHNISLIDDDIALVEQNPALLGPEFENVVGLNYMRYLAGSNFAGARYGNRINDHSAWGAAIQYFGYGTMTATDVEGNVTGTFSASDIAFTGNYAHDINDRWRGGIAIKVISSSYESYSALAIATDLGVNYYDPDNDFSASLVLKNLGGQVKKFADTYDKLPWDVQVGFTKGFTNSPFRISVTLTNLNKWHLPYYAAVDNTDGQELVLKDSFGRNLLRHFTLAAEYAPTSRIYIGLGYSYKTRTDMSTYARNFVSGFSVAAGLKVRGFGFGVAVAQPHSGGTTFMLNIGTSITELMR